MIRKVIVGGGLTAAAVALTAAPAFANTISLQALPDSFDSSHPITPGDTLQAGYAFAIPGSHPAETVGFDQAKVSFPVSCSPENNPGPTAGTITIPLGGGPYSVAANDGTFLPSAQPYQGSISAPDLCSGGPMYITSTTPTPAPAGGNKVTFSADLQATVSNSIQVKFHYQDVNIAHGGSFSGTTAFAPDVTTTPVPLGALGALGVAVPIGAGLFVMQRRSHKRRQSSAEA
jgi:hypothetical protein